MSDVNLLTINSNWKKRHSLLLDHFTGGTADMTVHEKLKDGRLKELHRASGNDCGGTSVDGRFFQMLVRILGGPLMKKIKDKDQSAYLDLFREFESVKRTIKVNNRSPINISIPFASLDFHCKDMLDENLIDVIRSSSIANEISLRRDKLQINANLIYNLFKPTIDNILSLMNEILTNKKVKNVSHILLVGGFSECCLIQDAVMKKFVNTKIIIPDEAGLSVLKGAVLFGHKPDYVQSRVMRFTYGVGTTTEFDPTIHKIEHRTRINDKLYCDNIFAIFVSKNQVVEAGKKTCKDFQTTSSMQKEVQFDVFVSTSEDPMYTKDSSCTKLCEIVLELPNPSEEKRSVDVEFVFGNTEIYIKAIDHDSGNLIKTKLRLI